MKTLVQTINGLNIFKVKEGRSVFHYVSKTEVNKNGIEYQQVEFEHKTLHACVNYCS